MRKDQKVLPYVFNDKQTNIRNYVESMLNRTQSMFIYGNLPETINQRQLELKNQTHGFTIWCNVDESEIVQDPNSRKLEGGLYALNGGFGGIEDLNGDPTFVTIAHPRLKQSKVLKIDEECVLMRNDPFMQGLLPILERYCSMLVENDISINLADIMSRATAIITAGDDTTMENARMYIKKIIDGEISVIGELSSLEGYKGIETQPFMNGVNNTITNLIELQQYLKASMWNDLGLNANWNAKRESINSGESELNHDALLPLIDTMLHSRQEALAKINEIFGTNITVELHSAWKDVQELHEEQDADGDMQLDEGEQNPDETAPEEAAGVEEMQPEPEIETTENVIGNADNEEPEIQPNGSIKTDAPTENTETEDVENEEEYPDDDELEDDDDDDDDDENGSYISSYLKNLLGEDAEQLEKSYGRWITIKGEDEEGKGQHIYIDDNGNINNDAGFRDNKAKRNGTPDTPEELSNGKEKLDPNTEFEEYDPYDESGETKADFTFENVINNNSIEKLRGFKKLNKEHVNSFLQGSNVIFNEFGISPDKLKAVCKIKAKYDLAWCLPGQFAMNSNFFDENGDEWAKPIIEKEKERAKTGKPHNVGGDTDPETFRLATGAHESTHFIVGEIVLNVCQENAQVDKTRLSQDVVHLWNSHEIEGKIIGRISQYLNEHTDMHKKFPLYPSGQSLDSDQECLAEIGALHALGKTNETQEHVMNMLKNAYKTSKKGTYNQVLDSINNYDFGGDTDGK